MDAVKLLHVGEQPRRHHLRCAVDSLLRGLKNYADGAGQGILPLLQHQRRAKHAGRMKIVAAGMHLSLFAGSVRQAGFLRDRKRVHIAAQADRPSRLFAADLGDHAGRKAGIEHGDAVPAQLRLYAFGGPELLQPQFRMPVQILIKQHQFLFRHRSSSAACAEMARTPIPNNN